MDAGTLPDAPVETGGGAPAGSASIGVPARAPGTPPPAWSLPGPEFGFFGSSPPVSAIFPVYASGW